jgi:hypothetical protein
VTAMLCITSMSETNEHILDLDKHWMFLNWDLGIESRSEPITTRIAMFISLQSVKCADHASAAEVVERAINDARRTKRSTKHAIARATRFIVFSLLLLIEAALHQHVGTIIATDCRDEGRGLC